MLAMPTANAYALTCKNGDKPVYEVDCNFGKCGICYSPKSTWEEPRVEIVYKPLNIFPEVRTSLKISQCKFNGGIRFCMRAVDPKKGKNHYGNKTAKSCDPEVGETIESCKCEAGTEDVNGECMPRQQLCGYEDWMDGMDIHPNYNPHHHNEDNDPTAIGITVAAVGITTTVVLAGFGPIITGITAAIIAHWNHVVPTNIGCLERPITVGPPAWRNDAWHTAYVPPPEIVYGPGSTFLEPLIQLNFCKKDGKAWMCKRDPETGELEAGLSYSQVIDMTPKFTEEKDAADGRSFRAEITTEDPDEICVYKTKEANSKKVALQNNTPLLNMQGSGKTVNVLQGCLPRPGYMPKPEIKVIDKYKVEVTFAGEKATLWDDINEPDSPNRCATMQQIQFCLVHDKWGADGNSGSVCLEGYDTVPVVVAGGSAQDMLPVTTYDTEGNIVSVTPGTANDIAVSSALRPPGNTLKPANVAFDNYYANPETDQDREFVIQQVKFPKDLLVYEQPACYQTDAEGRCLNYKDLPGGGVCCSSVEADFITLSNTPGTTQEQINNAQKLLSYCKDAPEPYEKDGQCLQYVRNTISTGGDPYYVDPEKYHIRPVSSREMGLCSAVDDGADFWLRDKPGTYQYTPPYNCGVIEIQAWGAGAAGSAIEGYEIESGYSSLEACQNHFAGGAGAYGKWKINVSTFDGPMTVIVGAGGSTNRGTAGTATRIISGNQKITIGGGYGVAPSGACDSPDCDMKNGGVLGPEEWEGSAKLQGWNGPSGLCNWGKGADGPGGGWSKSDCNDISQPAPAGKPGAGGCTHDSKGNEPWGAGGHGAVQIKCIGGAF